VIRPRRVVAVVLGVLALGSLSACSSTPSNRRVVSDVIESLEAAGDLDEEQEACMLDRLEGYSDDQLDAIADENENWDPSSGSTIEEASPAMRQFIDDFAECTAEGGPASVSSQPTASSEPTATSEATATTSSG
jgi:hypothetical protein